MHSLASEFTAKIKCIYIDPPYNTGNRFSHYDDDVEHTRWLEFMQARLEALRPLLREDGVIFVSIGDEECAYLKVLMDGIFGRKNFCGTLVWEKKKKPSFLDRHMGSVTEFILAYVKNRALAGPFTHGTTTHGKKYPLNNAGNGVRVLRFDAGSVQFNCADGFYMAQDMSQGAIVTRLLDDVEVKNGVNTQAFRLEGEWRYSQETLDTIMTAGESLTISKAPFRPNHIKPGGAPKKLKNLISLAHYDIGTYEDATEESRRLFGDQDAFDYPKPEQLMHLLLNSATRQNDWVLDAFAGSGTTGAVAHKMNRRWMMIEQGEHCRTHLLPRMQKVTDGQDPGGVTSLTGWQGGGGFQYFQA